MLGLLDFRDALKALFLDSLPLKQLPLSTLQGQEMALDSRSLIAYIQTIKQTLNFKDNVGRLKTLLQKYNIDIVFFENTIDVVDYHALVTPCKTFIKFLEAYFYAAMISELLHTDKTKDEARFKEFIQTLAVFRKDSITAYVIAYRYQFNVQNVIRNLGIRLVISPQFREAQIGHFLTERPNRFAMSYPVTFLFSQVTRIVNLIDFENETFSYFDLEDLASFYKCTPSILRKCLFGCLIYFNCHPKMKMQSKILEALNDGFEKFPTAYLLEQEERKKKVDELLRFFLERVSNDKIDRYFMRQIACHFNFDTIEVREFFSLFRSSLCLTSDQTLVPFPTSQFVLSASRLHLNLPTQELLLLYCRGLLSDDLAKLLNANANHTLVILFPSFDNVELLYGYRALYKSALEHNVAVLMTYFRLKIKKTFRITFTRNQTDQLDLRQTRLPVYSSMIESKSVLSFYDVIIRHSSFFNLSLSQTLTESTTCDNPSKAINYLNLNLFNYLGYINILEAAIYVPGHVMLTTGPDLYENNIQEELLIIFELIRNNFLKPSIFDVRNPFMSKNVPQLNDRFINCLVKSYVWKNQGQNNSFSMASIHSFDEKNSTDDSFSREEKESETGTAKIYDDPEILSNYERNLMAIQKAIKEFQKEFVRNLDLDYPISDFEEIITDALAGNQLAKVILISRFYLFAITDFHINDYYDQDTYQFRELVMVVLKSINSINKANLVALLKSSGNLDNLPLISSITSKLPFRKNYSLDACTFVKVLMTQFLISKALKAANHPLAKIYLLHIKEKHVNSVFKERADFCKFIEDGRLLFKKAFIMVKALQKFTNDDFTSNIYCEMTDAYPVFKQFCEFIVKIQPDN